MRIIKDEGVIILTACGGFTNMVVNSMPSLYRYKWIWVKNNVTNFHNAKNKPMSSFEEVLTFSKGSTANHSKIKMRYYPQGIVKIGKGEKQASLLIEAEDERDEYLQEYTNYPRDVLHIK